MASMALLTGIVILVILWIARISYKPGVLHGTVPCGAVLVTCHSNPGDRFAGFATNSILRGMIQSLHHDSQDGITSVDPNVARGIKALAGCRETVFACVPSPIPGEDASWYAASWIGASSIYIRFMLFFRPLPGLRPVGQYAGWTIWGMDQPITESGMKLSAAVGDGILFLCLSRQSSGVKHAIAAHEGLAPSSPPPAAHTAPGIRLTSDDTGWFRMGPHVVKFELSEATSTRLAFRFHVEMELAPLRPLHKAADLETPRQLLADLPVILAAAPVDTIRSLAADDSSPAWLKTAGEFLDMDEFADDPGVAVLSVHTGIHGGGFGRHPFRMRIPSVVLMIKASGADAPSLLNRILDRLNAEYHLGLIVHPETQTAGDLPLWILEATNDNLLAQLEPEDRLACAALDEWIIFGSNAKSLASLLAGARGQAPDEQAIGWYHVSQSRSAAALLWVNTEEAARAAQLPMLLLSIKMGSGGATGGTYSHENIDRARTLLKAADSFRVCSILLESETGHPVLHVSFDVAGPGI